MNVGEVLDTVEQTLLFGSYWRGLFIRTVKPITRSIQIITDMKLFAGLEIFIP